MAKFGFFLLILVATLVAYRIFGILPALAIFAMVVGGFLIKANPSKGWGLLTGITFLGMLVGSVLTIAVFAGGSPLLGAVLALVVYGCYTLRQVSKRRQAQHP